MQQPHTAASQETTQQHVNNKQMREVHHAAHTVNCMVEDTLLLGEPMLCLAPRHVILKAMGERHGRGGGEEDTFPCFTAGVMSRKAM